MPKNDQQIAVKKRLIYAEDLFEPVDAKVFVVGGRSGGKTMAMYESLFRKRVELAPTIDAVPVVRCKDCKHYKSYGPGLDGFESFGKCLYINMDVDMPVGGYCCYGERRADHD
jgi:hypothetical protein